LTEEEAEYLKGLLQNHQGDVVEDRDNRQIRKDLWQDLDEAGVNSI